MAVGARKCHELYITAYANAAVNPNVRKRSDMCGITAAARHMQLILHS